MNDILAITADPASDDVLISELAGSDADRVTVLMAGCRPESDEQSARRLMDLVRAGRAGHGRPGGRPGR